MPNVDFVDARVRSRRFPLLLHWSEICATKSIIAFKDEHAFAISLVKRPDTGVTGLISPTLQLAVDQDDLSGKHLDANVSGIGSIGIDRGRDPRCASGAVPCTLPLAGYLIHAGDRL